MNQVPSPDIAMITQRPSMVRLSPDGKHVLFLVERTVIDDEGADRLRSIYLTDLDGNNQILLTEEDYSCNNPEWSPDGLRVAFTSRRNRKNEIWLRNVHGGEAQPLLHTKGDVSSFKWSPSGEKIAFVTASPPDNGLTASLPIVNTLGRLNQLFVIPIPNGVSDQSEIRLLSPPDVSVGVYHGLGWYDWSPDSNTIVFVHVPTSIADDSNSGSVSLVDVHSGTMSPLVVSGSVLNTPFYSPDGRFIAYVASDDPHMRGGRSRIYTVPSSGGKPRALSATQDCLPTLVGWSGDSKNIYFTEDEHTNTKLYTLPIDGSPREISEGDGVISDLHLNQACSTVGFVFETTNDPPEVHVSSLETFLPSRISNVNLHLRGARVNSTKLIRWKGKGDVDIEGLLTYPSGFQKGKRYPLLLIIHGGPTRSFKQLFIGQPLPYEPYPIAEFAARGYAVLRGNIRGSRGYGAEFRYALREHYVELGFRDAMAGVDCVIDMGLADPDRMGVMGWSYGGYLTAWIITHTTRFNAASIGAGTVNLVSMAGTTDIPSSFSAWLGGEPWDNFEVYLDQSPISHIKGVSTPTLIQHGEVDRRVPVSQGYELYNALKRQGCVVDMAVYPRTGHSLEDPHLFRDVMNRNVEWFDQYVGVA
jgi:dipeptidyl aminopeptidase/acylaminoacyl peptidase